MLLAYASEILLSLSLYIYISFRLLSLPCLLLVPRSILRRVVSHGSFLRLLLPRLCSLEPSSSLSLSSSKVDPYCTRLLAFKVPLVALPDAPPSWNSRFSPSLVPPPPPTPFQSPRSPLAALGLLEFYRARYPRCRLRFILQLSLIQRIPWSVIITPGHFRLLLFSTRFSFVCTFVGCGRGNWKPGFRMELALLSSKILACSLIFRSVLRRDRLFASKFLLFFIKFDRSCNQSKIIENR